MKTKAETEAVGVVETHKDLTSEDVATILDPSDKFRPEKDEAQFRDYTKKGEFYDRVKALYDLQHTTQSYKFAKDKFDFWTQFNHGKFTLLEAVEHLNKLVDESDPDIDIANSVHAFQTAERIREAHPTLDWFHLIGLIHDLGKMMAIFGEPQYHVTGDTFPLGCEFSEKCVFGKDSFKNNPDFLNPDYSSPCGVYQPNCGLSNVLMCWGHDEYMYRVLKNHPTCSIPEKGLYMIRFHSFYPWHTAGDYMQLCDAQDLDMLNWVREFNKFDLYSKADKIPDEQELVPYYQSLVDKYCPGALKW